MTQAVVGKLTCPVFGPEQGQVIVFLHGGGGAGWMWQPVIEHLPGYRCLTPDLPEHGQNRSTGPFSMESAADLVAELIQTQTPGRSVCVVGLSEGAQVAVSLLSRHPETIAMAVISSALLKPLPGSSLISPGVLRFTYRTSVAPLRNSDWWIRLNMKYSAGIPDQYYTQFKNDFQSMSEEAFVHLMDANLRFRLPPGIEKAQVPTLVVTGKKEYGVMKQSARELAAALPNGQAYQLDLGSSAGLAQEHNWALSAPALFAQTVKSWINGKPLPDELTPLQ